MIPIICINDSINNNLNVKKYIFFYLEFKWGNNLNAVIIKLINRSLVKKEITLKKN